MVRSRGDTAFMDSIGLATHPLADMMQREISRFVETSIPFRRNLSLSYNRRGVKRHDRECPIFVAILKDSPPDDIAATLRNISDKGLGFHCDVGLRKGTLISVKLFWSDANAPRVPARVRHCDIEQEGFLIGAEFALDDVEACKIIEKTQIDWYG